MTKKRHYITKDELTKEIITSKKTQQEHPDWTPAQCFTGKLTNFINLLVDGYANKSSWRNYSWLEDMKSEARLTLCQNAFKYDETRFDNPFGYYTQIVKFCFITFIEREDVIRDIKDNLWESIGMTPSHNRQVKNEILSSAREAHLDRMLDEGKVPVLDTRPRDTKTHKKEVEELTARIDQLSKLTTLVNRLTEPDCEIDGEIARLIAIDVKPYTSNLLDVLCLLDQSPYTIERDVELAGQQVDCLVVVHQKTKCTIRKVLKHINTPAVILTLCAIAIVIHRDLLVKQLREITGYNLSNARIPIAEPRDTEAEIEAEIEEPKPKKRETARAKNTKRFSSRLARDGADAV